MKNGFIKVCAATPELKVANTTFNVNECVKLAEAEIAKVFGDVAGYKSEAVDTGSYGEIVGACPLCGKNVVRGTRGYGCMGYSSGCEFRMGLAFCKREIPIVEIKRMFAEGRTARLPGFISKTGKLFTARLKLDCGKVAFDFDN